MPSFGDKLSSFWSRVGPRIGSRQRTKEILSTLLIVVPLTLLIWIYAERAQDVKDTAEITPRVAMTEPTLIATVVSPPSGALALDLESPKALIDQLKKQLAERAMDNSLTLTLPPALTHVGQQNVDIANTLNNDPLILNSGVSITKATPPLMTVTVDPLSTRTLPVAVPPDLARSLQSVSFDPPTVTVRGPKPRVDALFPGDATVFIDTANRASDFTTAGTRTIEVPLVTLPLESRVTISPKKVKMTVEIGARDRDYTIPNVPIVVQKLLSLEKTQVVVKGPPLVQNVHIHGPASLISRFEGSNPQCRLTAVLRISPDDVGKMDLQRVPELMMLRDTPNRGTELTVLPPDVKADPIGEVDFDVNSGAPEQ